MIDPAPESTEFNWIWKKWFSNLRDKVIDKDGGQTINGDHSITGDVTLSGLPTSDPSVAGRLWNDSGTLKISAG
jgi:hypothetical protein